LSLLSAISVSLFWYAKQNWLLLRRRVEATRFTKDFFFWHMRDRGLLGNVPRPHGRGFLVSFICANLAANESKNTTTADPACWDGFKDFCSARETASKKGFLCPLIAETSSLKGVL
jgi:hypothetical protein